MLKVQYESMIAEIVDNSMDNNAENVLIDSRCDGMNLPLILTMAPDSN